MAALQPFFLFCNKSATACNFHLTLGRGSCKAELTGNALHPHEM